MNQNRIPILPTTSPWIIKPDDKIPYTGFSRLGGLWLYQYDELGQVTSGKKFTPSGQEIPGQQFTYSFDDIGNRKTSTNSPQVDYTANDLNQYVSRTVPGEFTLSGKTATDASAVAIQNEATGQAFRAERLENYFYVPQTVDNSDTSYLIDYKVTALDVDGTGQAVYSTQNLDVHVPKNPEQFTYDADGNLASDARWNYQWDAENRRKSQVTRDMWDHFGDIDYANLTEADLPDSTVAERGDLIATYKYDYQSRRTEKKVWKFHVEEGEPGTGGEIPMITQIREKLAETIARIEERRDNAIAHIQAKIEKIQNSHMPQRVKDKLIRQLERQIERETAKADQQIAHETDKAEKQIAKILEHADEMIAKLQAQIEQVEEWRDRHVECIQSVIDWLNEHRDELEDGNGHGHGRGGKHGWGKKRDILKLWKQACDHGHGHWKKRWKHGKKCGDLPLFPHFIGFHCGRDWDVYKLIELLEKKIVLINELADKRIAKLQAKIDALTGCGTGPVEPVYEWRLTHQRFAYDGNNVVAIFNVESETDETTGETTTLDVLSQTMLWGEDLSGSLDGAGGVGGLLAVSSHSVDGEGNLVEKAYLPVYDGNGNVMAYVDAATGEEKAEFEYSPFGKLKVDTDSEGLFVFRFSTKMYDGETGNVHYRYRDYDPELGRWLSRDKIGEKGGNGLYVFCRNEPVSQIDILGNDFIAIADRPVDSSLWLFYHYSIEYWKCGCEEFEPLNYTDGFTKEEIQNKCAGKAEKIGAIEAMPTPGKVWAIDHLKNHNGFTVDLVWEKIEVQISFIHFSDAADVDIMPVVTGKPETIRRYWERITNKSRNYRWAEQKTVGLDTFPNWPRSLYAKTQTNSNTFVRYIMFQAGIGMVEMDGSHPGNMWPSQNTLETYEFLPSQKPWTHSGSGPDSPESF